MTKPLRIETTLEPRGPAAAIVLTDEQVELLAPGKKSFPVKVTINGTTLPLRLARMGDENLIGFSKAKRAEAGVEIGETYRVVIEPDLGERQVDVPDDLAAALKAGQGHEAVRRARLLAPQGVRAADHGGEEARDAGSSHRRDGHQGPRRRDALTSVRLTRDFIAR